MLIFFAMILQGFDSPATGMTLLTGMVLLILGGLTWACKLPWYEALTIGGMLLGTACLAGTYVPQIVSHTFVGDERPEFLIHLINYTLGVLGIVLILAGFVSLFRWLLSLLKKGKK